MKKPPTDFLPSILLDVLLLAYSKINESFSLFKLRPNTFRPLSLAPKIKGLFHSDELPKYGITQEEEEAKRMQEAIKAEMLQVVGITNKLLNPSVYSDKVFEASTGAFEGGNPLFGATFTLGADYQDVTNFTNDISYLQDLSTLENLGRMTGVLSESDIALLRQAATGINLKSDANQLKRRLGDLNEKIVEKLGVMGLSAEEIQGSSKQYGGGALDEVISRFNTPSSRSSTRRGPR